MNERLARMSCRGGDKPPLPGRCCSAEIYIHGRCCSADIFQPMKYIHGRCCSADIFQQNSIALGVATPNRRGISKLNFVLDLVIHWTHMDLTGDMCRGRVMPNINKSRGV